MRVTRPINFTSRLFGVTFFFATFFLVWTLFTVFIFFFGCDFFFAMRFLLLHPAAALTHPIDERFQEYRGSSCFSENPDGHMGTHACVGDPEGLFALHRNLQALPIP